MLDQPAPIHNTYPAVTDLVVIDLQTRKKFGTRKYGVPLQAFNGRDALFDLYEEILDASAYCKQRLLEEEQERQWVECAYALVAGRESLNKEDCTVVAELLSLVLQKT